MENPLRLTSLNHISLVCRSLQKSIDFYTNVLGFVPVRRPNSFNFDGAWLFSYGIGIHLLQSEDPEHMMKKSKMDPKESYFIPDLSFGILVPLSTTSHARNFTSKGSPNLGRATVGKGQPQAISSLGNAMSTMNGPCFDIATQSLGKAEARGKNKAGASIDPDAHLRCAIETLKVQGLNKQQVLAVVAKTVDDTFVTQVESILN
ncbi:hypothetical protein HYC85_029353 [Camellia sinensis]|uniref:Glyoxalase/fosfomycin resistance/dioxygenase domain-containing protein n=1 Tax=Camellia sinensis TaxID=4442 RepID=A0A7J7FXU5_CAMSI|nr:hypothetical protein HYC85_029353 [Camellia sinensis]